MYLFWWHPFYKYAAFAPVHFILPRAQVPVTGLLDWRWGPSQPGSVYIIRYCILYTELSKSCTTCTGCIHKQYAPSGLLLWRWADARMNPENAAKSSVSIPVCYPVMCNLRYYIFLHSHPNDVPILRYIDISQMGPCPY